MTSPPARAARIRRRMAIPAAIAAAALTLAACASSGANSSGNGPIVVSSPTSTSAYDGDTLPQPVTLSTADETATFSSSTGGTTTLSALGKDKLMLLYFGYTHCPDVCPTTMADLGQALRQISSLYDVHTQVVFVTSDPARDTPAVMQSWLNNFDSGLSHPFVGLTASIKQIDAVATSVGVPLEPPVTNPDGSITVEHGAQTLAFLNGKANLLWLAGTTPAQYAHDITTLVNSSGAGS